MRWSADLRWEMILDPRDGPYVITGVLTSGQGGRERGNQGRWCERTQPEGVGFVDAGAALSWGTRAPPEAGKGLTLPWTLWKEPALLTPGLSPVRSIQDPNLQDLKTVNLCCLKPPNLRERLQKPQKLLQSLQKLLQKLWPCLRGALLLPWPEDRKVLPGAPLRSNLMPAVRGAGRSVRAWPAWGAPEQHMKAWALCPSHRM